MEKELTLALTIRESLQAITPPNLAAEIYRSVEPELLKLIYAKNKDLADIAHQKIRATLAVNLNQDDPIFQQVDNLLAQLVTQRQGYLKSPSASFLSFWAEEGWEGGNYALLIVPFLLSTLFPPAGIALLIYTLIVTATAAIDFARKSPEFWLEKTSPNARELSDQQREALKKKHGDIELFLPEKNLRPDPVNEINYRSYFLYGLIFAISLIGLASLLFPPIGIPAVALTTLSVVAIVATSMQMNLLFQTRQHQLAEIRYERETSSPTKSEGNNSTELISEKLPKRTMTPSPQATPHPILPQSSPSQTETRLPKQEEKKDIEEGEDENEPHLHH